MSKNFILSPGLKNGLGVDLSAGVFSLAGGGVSLVEKIIFSDETNDQIYMINPDGTGSTNISNNAFVDLFGSVSRDGTKIAITSNEAGGGSRYLYFCDLDSTNGITNRVQISTVSGSGSRPLPCSISLDNNYIIYSLPTGGGTTQYIKIYDVANTTDNNLLDVSSFADDVLNVHINLAQNKLYIQYDPAGTGFDQIRQYDLDLSTPGLSNPVDLSKADSDELQEFAFNSDETQLIARNSTGNNIKLYDFDPSGSPHQLTNSQVLTTTGVLPRYPSFNPTDLKFLYSAFSSTWDLFTDNFAGTDLTRVTNTSPQEFGFPQNGWVLIKE